MRTRIGLAIAVFLSLQIGVGRSDDIDALRKEIDKLKQQVKSLENIIEGTAQPINLGRTSLAAVRASTVNGSRPLDNIYYGVVNAFDDGNNVYMGINYTYWLSSSETSPWIEVRFDQPVSVTSIHVESPAVYTTRFTFAKGGEKTQPVAVGDTKLAALHGVKSVRLTFGDNSQNVSIVTVHEVRILGQPAPGVKYTGGRPRVLLDSASALLRAQEALEQWRQNLTTGLQHKISDDDEHFTVTYYNDAMSLLRITINKNDGAVRVTPLVQFTPAAK